MQFNAILDNLKSYEAGKPIELVVREYGIDAKNIIKLASNENPRGCSPKVLEAVRTEAPKMMLYPDDSMYELKEGLAHKFEVKSENIMIGAGSDQILDFAVHAKANATNKILMAGITFAMYEIYGRQTGTGIIKTPSAKHDLAEFKACYEANKESVSIIFLCLPNNPLGECLDTKDVYDFMETVSPETLIVIDGAYQEYASYKDPNKAIDPKELIEKFPNALYTGTFSKAYGLGGMRCGYGIARPEIIKALGKLRAPFNITTLSLKAGIEALKDQAFVDACIKENFSEMAKYEAFAKDLGFDFIESYTNFITLDFPNNKNASEISEKLLKQGIIVRDLSAYGMNAVRVTVGTPEQNSRFFEIFKTVYA